MRIFRTFRYHDFTVRKGLAIHKKDFFFFISNPYSRGNKRKWYILTVKERPKLKYITEIRINPFPHWKYRIIWRMTQFWYKLTYKGYMLCQGCGEGVSKFRIRDPNHGHGNERYNCCDNCVNFYDWRWSAMDIVGWKKDEISQLIKPICKKGNRCIEKRKSIIIDKRIKSRGKK